MTKPIFDHDRLDVYRLSIEYVSLSFAIAKQLAVLIVTLVINGFVRRNRFRSMSLRAMVSAVSRIGVAFLTSREDQRWSVLQFKMSLRQLMD